MKSKLYLVFIRNSYKYRKKRFILFQKFLETIPEPCTILDVGGTMEYWESMESLKNKKIVLLNLIKYNTRSKNIHSLKGDARDMSRFKENEFDVVFSNSVIEHVGNIQKQKKMADEVKRVGKYYFIQTPNKNFPLEPHFIFPFFQFLPMRIKLVLLTQTHLTRYRFYDKKAAEDYIRSIRLLTKKELKTLFPKSKIYEEKVLGLTKSFIIFNK